MSQLYFDGVSYWIKKVNELCREYCLGRLHDPYFHANDGTIWVILPDGSARKDIRHV